MRGCGGTSIACPRSDTPIEVISQVETLDCSVVKLLTTPHKPTTSCCKSRTSFSILLILYEMVRGLWSGGGGGGLRSLVMVLESHELTSRLPDQAYRPHGPQSAQLAAALSPWATKPCITIPCADVEAP
ncbi:hypothetical protein Tco_0641766 [Tanacetum coccineum]